MEKSRTVQRKRKLPVRDTDSKSSGIGKKRKRGSKGGKKRQKPVEDQKGDSRSPLIVSECDSGKTGSANNDTSHITVEDTEKAIFIAGFPDEMNEEAISTFLHDKCGGQVRVLKREVFPHKLRRRSITIVELESQSAVESCLSLNRTKVDGKQLVVAHWKPEGKPKIPKRKREKTPTDLKIGQNALDLEDKTEIKGPSSHKKEKQPNRESEDKKGDCRQFSKHGKCPRGESCPFSHATTCKGNGSGQQGVGSKMSGVCHQFSKHGKCPRGDACPYSHENCRVSQSQQGQKKERDADRKENFDPRTICKFFRKFGSCKLGEKCSFLHKQPAKVERHIPAGEGTKNTVFVGNLAFSYEESDVSAIFSECGRVASVRIIRDKDRGGKSKGMAFVEFKKSEHFEKALNLHGKAIDGRAISVKVAKPKGKTKDGEETKRWKRSKSNLPSDGKKISKGASAGRSKGKKTVFSDSDDNEEE